MSQHSRGLSPDEVAEYPRLSERELQRILKRILARCQRVAQDNKRAKESADATRQCEQAGSNEERPRGTNR